MKRLAKLRRQEAGAAAIEMAIALPVLVFLIYGIFEAAMLFYARAGMQHGIGEGARLATIFPTPADSAVSTRVSEKLFGMSGAKTGFPTVTVTPNTTTTPRSRTITVVYKKDVNFLFLATREITLSESKTVYVAQ